MAELETISSISIAPRRKSKWVNRKPAANLLNAINLAGKLGRPLNQFVTLNFSHTACPAEAVSQQFERLRDNHFGPWLRRNSPSKAAPPSYVWCIENTGACAVHWLVHIPVGRTIDFQKRLPRWLEAVTGDALSHGAINVRPADRPGGAGKYMLKGIDPQVAELYGIRPVDQGLVHGKRTGFSRCLGPTTRRRLADAGEIRPLRRIGLPRRPTSPPLQA